MKLFFCQCRVGGKPFTKHIAAENEELAKKRFVKEASQTGKYVGNFKVKEINRVDECEVQLIRSGKTHKKTAREFLQESRNE